MKKHLRKRIDDGHQVFLDELKPTKAQREHGLELHADSFVADAQGGVPVSTPVGLAADHLQADINRLRKTLEADGLDATEVSRRLDAEWKRRKTFESAFDPAWQKLVVELYREAGVDIGCEDVAHPGENSFDDALRHVARNNFIYDCTDGVVRIGHAGDIDLALETGWPAVVQHMAGVGAFAEADDPLARIDLFYTLGVRMMQLTYIQQNKLCCSWMQDDDQGLTDLGHKAVARMNELGIMVDIAHCGDRSSIEIIEASAEPVLLSHTACRAVYDDATNPFYVNAVMKQDYARGVPHPKKTGSRNASDDILRALAKRGGVAAIYSIDYVIGPRETSNNFAAFVRHIEHAVGVMGIDHVTIGSDRTHFQGWRPSSLDWTNWPYWTVGLVCRGFSDSDIRKLIGGNYLRYAQRVLNKRPWGPLM